MVRPSKPNSGAWPYCEYVDRLERMALDEWFDVDNPPTDEKGRIKLRTGLSARAGLNKFKLRSWSSGRLQIIKTGRWPSAWEGEEGVETATKWDTRQNKPTWQRPAQFFLGFMRNRGEKFWRPPKCIVRNCPFPTYNFSGELCSYHGHWYDHPISMTDTALDISELYNPREPYQPYYLHMAFPVKTESLEKTLRFERNGYIDERHKNAGKDEFTEVEDGPDRAVATAKSTLRDWAAFFGEGYAPEAAEQT